MNRITHFSKHAIDRLEQRSVLISTELARILDCGIFVEIGNEPGFNRSHRLFYSEKDDDFYVAIQDVHTGAIVTVLPPDYHGNIAWRIKDEEFVAAKNIASNPPKATNYYDQESEGKTPARFFVIAASIGDGHDKYKTEVVLKVDALLYDLDIENVVGSSTVARQLRQIFAEKQIPHSFVAAISIRLGKKGSPVYFGWGRGGFS